MKKGFSIEIQLDLTDEEKKLAEKFALSFIKNLAIFDLSFSTYFNTHGGHKSFLRRGRIGFLFDEENALVFRRISNHQRRFAVVKLNTLLYKDTNLPVDEKRLGCTCPRCLGDRKVIWKYLPETYTYAIIGDIKG